MINKIHNKVHILDFFFSLYALFYITIERVDYRTKNVNANDLKWQNSFWRNTTSIVCAKTIKNGFKTT